MGGIFDSLDTVNSGRTSGDADLSHPDAPDVAQDVPIFPEDAALINGIYSDLGDSAADSLAHAVINSEDLEKAIEHVQPEQAERVQHAIEAVQDHAAAYVSKKTGGDGRAILDWASTEFNRESLQQVARLHFFGSNMSGYDAIIKEYRKAHPSK